MVLHLLHHQDSTGSIYARLDQIKESEQIMRWSQKLSGHGSKQCEHVGGT